MINKDESESELLTGRAHQTVRKIQNTNLNKFYASPKYLHFRSNGVEFLSIN